MRIIYEELGETVKKFASDVYIPHLGGTDPVLNPGVTPLDVWIKDHREVASSDLVIAYVGEPSLGVGAELEIARVTASNIILWWFKGEKVSRMALGNPAVSAKIEADNKEDLLNKIYELLIKT